MHGWSRNAAATTAHSRTILVDFAQISACVPDGYRFRRHSQGRQPRLEGAAARSTSTVPVVLFTTCSSSFGPCGTAELTLSLDAGRYAQSAERFGQLGVEVEPLESTETETATRTRMKAVYLEEILYLPGSRPRVLPGYKASHYPYELLLGLVLCPDAAQDLSLINTHTKHPRGT